MLLRKNTDQTLSKKTNQRIKHTGTSGGNMLESKFPVKQQRIMLTENGLRFNSMLDPNFLPSDEAMRLLKLNRPMVKTEDANSENVDTLLMGTRQLAKAHPPDAQKEVLQSLDEDVQSEIGSRDLVQQQLFGLNPHGRKGLNPVHHSGVEQCTFSSQPDSPFLTVHENGSDAHVEGNQLHSIEDQDLLFQQQTVQNWLRWIDQGCNSNAADAAVQKTSDSTRTTVLDLAGFRCLHRAVAFHRTVCLLSGTQR